MPQPDGSPDPVATPAGGAAAPVPPILPPNPNPPADPPADPPPAQPAQEKVHHLADGAFKKLKDAERAKGARELREQLDRDAAELGYANHESMVRLLKTGARPAPPPDPADDPPEPPKPVARAQAKALEDAQRQLAEERRARQLAERKRKQIEDEAEARKGRHQLEKTAIRKGVQDVDFAVHLLEQHVAGLPDAEAEKFDEDAFFTKLKEDRPYLFGVTTVAANTGTAGGAPITTRTPQNPAPGSKFDAGKATPAEWEEYKRKRGWNQEGIS